MNNKNIPLFVSSYSLSSVFQNNFYCMFRLTLFNITWKYLQLHILHYTLYTYITILLIQTPYFNPSWMSGLCILSSLVRRLQHPEKRTLWPLCGHCKQNEGEEYVVFVYLLIPNEMLIRSRNTVAKHGRSQRLNGSEQSSFRYNNMYLQAYPKLAKILWHVQRGE